MPSPAHGSAAIRPIAEVPGIPRPPARARLCRPVHPLTGHPSPLGWVSRLLSVLVCLLIPLLAVSQPLWAAPVQWKEVTATADGRQWWDEGSLRFNREGYLTVLSRFQPAAPVVNATVRPSSGGPDSARQDPAAAGPEAGQRSDRPAPSTLYVMEIDCDQALYRDRSINGFHQFSPQWQPVVADDLIGEVISQACAAAATA